MQVRAECAMCHATAKSTNLPLVGESGAHEKCTTMN